MFPSHDHGVWKNDPPTIVKEGTAVGANSTILPSLTLGINCRIGAGSVVTKNIPSKELWVGVPAKKFKDK